jgi:hypothetical protein
VQIRIGMHTGTAGFARRLFKTLALSCDICQVCPRSCSVQNFYCLHADLLCACCL